jgi:hypothetical protein
MLVLRYRNASQALCLGHACLGHGCVYASMLAVFDILKTQVLRNDTARCWRSWMGSTNAGWWCAWGLPTDRMPWTPPCAALVASTERYESTTLRFMRQHVCRR